VKDAQCQSADADRCTQFFESNLGALKRIHAELP